MELSNDIEELKQLIASLIERVTRLEAENAQLRAENAQLKAENEALKLENADLRRRLGMNSRNSSRPPSSDGLTKKPALPKEPGKKNGGQVGHVGKTLRQVAEPDEIIVHHAAQCRRCRRRFSAAEVIGVGPGRQVFDIPRPRLEVVEHQVGEIVCCGESHWGEFPAEVTQGVQYGERIKALSVMLNTDYRLPLRRTEQLLADLYGCSLSEQTVLASTREGAEKLAPVEEWIKAELLKSAVGYFDETGLRVAGLLHWLHVASNEWWTYLFVSRKRGREALASAASVIKDFTGWAMHDCWESYFGFADCRHVLCNAHLLRELESLREQGSRWGANMQSLIFEMYRASEGGKKMLDDREEWERRYREICDAGEREEPPPIKGTRGKPKNSVGRNLLNRLKKHQAAVLEYAFTEEVPFTNNQAERDIRCAKIKQKVSNCFRKLERAQDYARIQGFISTARKQGMNVFEALVDVFSRKPINFPKC